MTPEQAAALRAPFPVEKVGKLPKVTCGACRESRERHCDRHTKSKCGECGAWITAAHMHVDYVGHADATDRFLEVDYEWNWEPFALDDHGLPAVDDQGGMWIRLTIAGMTRIGYGHADGKRGGDAVKEAIGDALRNAGLRFGVALDLWRKEPPVDESAGRRKDKPKPKPTPKQVEKFDLLAKQIAAAESDDGLKACWPLIVEAFKADELTEVQANELREELAQRRTGVPMKPRTRGRLFALFGEFGWSGDDSAEIRREFAAMHLDREVESMKTLTDDEAQKLIVALEKRKKAEQQPGLEGTP